MGYNYIFAITELKFVKIDRNQKENIWEYICKGALLAYKYPFKYYAF